LRGQAAIFSPYIKRFKKKIAGLEQVQVALKGELKNVQQVDAWFDDLMEWEEF
jgi:hypothetical protein